MGAVRKGVPMERCSATTKKGTPCPIWADRVHDGVWFCHVHDPAGVAQANLALVRKPKKLFSPKKPKAQSRYDDTDFISDPWWPLSNDPNEPCPF